VHGDVHDVRIIVEYILNSIAVMHIPVEEHDAPRRALPCHQCCNGGVVVHAEAHCPLALSCNSQKLHVSPALTPVVRNSEFMFLLRSRKRHCVQPGQKCTCLQEKTGCSLRVHPWFCRLPSPLLKPLAQPISVFWGIVQNKTRAASFVQQHIPAMETATLLLLICIIFLLHHVQGA
jgi:hypothetical protein